MSKLTIYFTSDTHGYLYPNNFASKQPRPMGLLPMSFEKDENTLVIDGGEGHVAAVKPLIEASGLDIPVFGMVKDEHHKTLTYQVKNTGKHTSYLK